MPERERDYSDSDQYRRGVVLGFTVAEIILLILFALLLALAGLLLNNRKDVERANAINDRFDSIISSLNLSNSSLVLKKINDVLDENIDYQRKIKEIENKLRVQSLPDDVYAEIRAQKIDLTTKEGKQKFLDILTSALAAQKEFKKNGGEVSKHFESACRAGFQLSEVLGKDKKPGDILDKVKDSNARSEYWQSQAARCGLAGVLPPCYRESNNEPIPYLYDARIKSDGVVLINTVPEKYKARFNSDFPNLPQENTTLSLINFSSSTSQFLKFGEKNSCRFYVVAYDDTLAHEKDRLKQLLKAIEGNFYKKTTW
jgi:hypothetical protein